MKHLITFSIILISFFNFIHGQNVGINILAPEVELDVRSTASVAGADFNLSNPLETHFLRMYSHTMTNDNPSIWWKNGRALFFSLGDENGANFNNFLSLNGKTIGFHNTGGSIFLGEDAGENDDLTENRNIAIGHSALNLSILGQGNVAIGDSSLYNSGTGAVFTSEGSYNTAVGQKSMFANTTGSDNTAIGQRALSGNTTGYSNVAIGLNAMRDNSMGIDNVALGRSAMVSNTMGNQNIALGRNSMNSNLTGSSNVVVGRGAMYYNETGMSNTIVGTYAGTGSPGQNYTGNIFLGFNAGRDVSASNRLFIDNSPTMNPLIYGEFDNNHIKINGSQDVTGELNIVKTGVALRVNGAEALWYNGTYMSYGFGAVHNYMVNPLRVGNMEGSTTPYADLHIVDSGLANVSIESYSSDAILQLTGNSNDLNNDWTIRRENSNGRMTWRNDNVQRMTLTSDGNLALGAGNPAVGYRLSVDGKIVAEEIRVQLSGDWPDYVFSDNYHLPKLTEVEKQISQLGHLPGIPSAQEVAQNGIEVGDMQKRMLEKVEELTLYIIQLEKRITELETQK